MPLDLSYLEGKKLCVCFLQDPGGDGADAITVQLRALHGRASIGTRGELTLEHKGGSFLIPSSSYNAILPSDGSQILKDAEYFVICKVSGMKL